MEASTLLITTPAELEKSIIRAVETITKNLHPIYLSKQREVMNIKQTSDFLGLSQSTLYTYISKRTIPFVKRNGTVYFLRSTLIEWLQEGEKKTIKTLTK